MNFILVGKKKGNKRKKIKKIAIYRKQNKGLKQKRICADALDEQSDGIERYLCKQACLETCLYCSFSSTIQDFFCWWKKKSLIVSYCIYLITKIHK